ncbi:hypothetical protein AYL99_00377 [Fonsecaea erecta]|uniref:Uncharacterized protein n=1 Tax=Fonsecaea erecta TaxID=1367422 RepID=A0A178ZZF7_9EURO|nr:hypothetical protein AYL99_00377 [Fonsecaea erecta]OAP64405.1 hypothetical protein AYL99_00377 [Fonsecaea erecta]
MALALSSRSSPGAISPPASEPASAHQQVSEDAPPQGGFLFIASTGQRTQKDPKQLKTLRAHVMRNYLERSHAEQQETEPKEFSVMSFASTRVRTQRQKTAVTGGQKMRFRMRSGELEQRYPHRDPKGKKKAKPARDGTENEAESNVNVQQTGAAESGFVPGIPVTWLEARKIDVFGVLPVRLDEGDEASLYLFRNYDRYPWCPINGQSSWSQFAISDQLVFHATMYSWGVHFRHRRAVPDSQEEMKTLQHKLAAISLINDRLSDSRQAASDETIAAVAALTNIALVMDSYPEASKHMAGMHAIVELRGGMSSLRSSIQQHLQRLISWNDLIYSEVFDEKLRFPPIEVWDESWAGFQQRTFSGPLPGLSRAELRAAGVPHHKVLDLLNDIRDLCEAEQLNPLSTLVEDGRMRRGDMFHRVERKLRLIVQGDTGPGNNRWAATVWRSVSLAALLFTHHHLRGNPLKYRHFNVLATQLYDTLLTMDEDLRELDFAPAMLTQSLEEVLTQTLKLTQQATASSSKITDFLSNLYGQALNINTVLCRSSLFARARPKQWPAASTEEMRQLSAQLHVLAGMNLDSFWPVARPAEPMSNAPHRTHPGSGYISWQDADVLWEDVGSDEDEDDQSEEELVRNSPRPIRHLHPWARSRVYDLRRYNDENMWGPFTDDGTERIDWEKVQAIMIVISYNHRMYNERRGWGGTDFLGLPSSPPDSKEEGGRSVSSTRTDLLRPWEYLFSGIAPNSYVSSPLTGKIKPTPNPELDALDPYGVTGTWVRIVCFLDYNDLYRFNFEGSADIPDDQEREPIRTREAFRLIRLQLHVTKIEEQEEKGKDGKDLLPVVHFEGTSRSTFMAWDPNANSWIRGTVRETPSGAIRWTSFSIIHDEERWRSEGVQVGGLRSARGILGNWFDKDYDVHGPAGPTAFWKVSDDIVEEKRHNLPQMMQIFMAE